MEPKPQQDQTPEEFRAATVREARKLVAFSAGFLLLFFGTVGLWAILAELYGAVVAPGNLKMEANLKLVQHSDGGLVRRIFVREGQHVAQGDPILELEDVEADSSMSMVRGQLDAELAKLARLTAEMGGSSKIDFPPELTARVGDASTKALLRNESNLFHARLRMLREQSERMREQRAAIVSEISSLSQQIRAAEKSLVYLNEQEKMNESLYTQNFVANARLLDAKRSTAEKEEKRFEFESLHAQARQRLADLELRLESLASNRLSENSKDLVDAQNKIINLRQQLKPTTIALERRMVRSPATGKINILRAHTEGGVIAPRETIAEIVPDRSLLVAEVRINPSDIDEVREGQEVRIELSGLNRRATPLLEGQVRFVSPDLNSDPVNPTQKYFVARVGLAETIPRQVTVSPGMPIAAYIRTRKRSPLELWLDPVVGAIRRSLRET